MYRLGSAVCFIVWMALLTVSAAAGQDDQGGSERIEQAWRGISGALREGDLAKAEQSLPVLETLMAETGFESLESESMQLIALGGHALSLGDQAAAARLLAMAERLSPRSQRVLVHALPLVKGLYGGRRAFVSLLQAGGLVWRRPEQVLQLAAALIYPVLWAFTLGLYAAFTLYFICHVQDILRKAARFFPVSLRGFLTPLVVLAALVLPICFGPLWCLTAWAALFYLLMPGHRWIGLCTGLLLCLWAAAIPLRENLSSWLDQEGIRTMLNVSTGGFNKGDREQLARLVQQRPYDGVVHYAYGQLLKKHEQYAEAAVEFAQAEQLLGPQPYTLAERGLLAFLAGRDGEADQLMHQAEAQGLARPEFYLNYSKVKFERMEVNASNDYYEKARAGDPDLARFYRSRETLLGVRSVRSCPDIQLPLRVLLLSLVRHSHAAGDRAKETAAALLPGFAPFSLVVLGGVLISLFFLGGGKKESLRMRSYYHQYRPSKLILVLVRLAPGGSWIVGHKPILTFLSLSLSSLLLMPLVRWPAESRYLLNALEPFYTAYCALVVMIMAALVVLAYSRAEGEE